MGIHVCMYNLFPLLQPQARLTPSWAPVSGAAATSQPGTFTHPSSSSAAGMWQQWQGTAEATAAQNQQSQQQASQQQQQAATAAAGAVCRAAARRAGSLEIYAGQCSITQAQNSATLAACFIHSPNNPVYHDWKRQFLLFQLDVNLVGRD